MLDVRDLCIASFLNTEVMGQTLLKNGQGVDQPEQSEIFRLILQNQQVIMLMLAKGIAIDPEGLLRQTKKVEFNKDYNKFFINLRKHVDDD